ncbi:MAG: FAD-dependent oxidoreductase [Oscillospiraceae bacterium]|jgi:glycine/D-amino acid oxidase-like deaminating enzyme|nr:FAD-dependent oxidoreductase [Oscillospiraceae bacterium]
MRSIWEQTARLPQFDALTGGVQTDVLIIGGGMAGILCAYFLEQAGVDYLLLEADRICGGVTGNTTAKITSQHGLIYSRLAREFGLEAARLYLEANEAALARYRSLCREIDCDFQEQDAYVYSLGRRDKLENEVAVLEQLGVPARLVSDLPLPIPAAGAVRFPGQAQFHPLRFIAAIARGLRIHEHTKVLSLRDGEAVTSGGTVRAGKVVAATHFPLLNRHGSYFLKLCQHRSYVLALRGAPELEGMYVDEAEDGLSLRSYHGLLLLGGGGHRTGKKGGGWAELSAVAQRAYPNAREAARWAAQDCMSLDGVPYIGQYSARTPGLFVAAGFNKWGMTSSMAAAMLLADLVRGRENPYAALFSPSRSILRPQLAANALAAAANLLTPTVPRCPHMGCALKYNRQEHSWDCPCHGSRFAQDGRLLDNPAMVEIDPPDTP